MKRNHRLIFLLLALLLLLGTGYGVTGSLQFVSRDYWFTSGLLLLVLLSLVDQPHFSKDANVFVNAITGWMSLLLIPPEDRGWLWVAFLGWMIYLGVSSYAIMLFRSRPLPSEGPLVQTISRINREIGRPEAIFSVFFLWGALAHFGSESSGFLALILFWAGFTILNFPTVAKSISDALDRRVTGDEPFAVVSSFTAPRVAEVAIEPAADKDLVGRPAAIVTSNGDTAAIAIVIEDQNLNGQRIGRLAITEKTDTWSDLPPGT